jgi:hypothetical protein
VIERAVVLSKGPELDAGPELLPEGALAAHLQSAAPRATAGVAAPANRGTLSEIESRYIEDVLARLGGVSRGPTPPPPRSSGRLSWVHRAVRNHSVHHSFTKRHRWVGSVA